MAAKMNKLRDSVLLMLLSVLFCLPAAAQTGFNGVYDYSTWAKTSTFGEPVVSSVNGTQQTLTIMEPNNSPPGPGGPQEYDLSHVVPIAGTISFNWSFDASIDACCSGLNFYVNGVLHNLTGGNFANPGNWNGAVTSGTFSIPVNAGDTIKFGAFSADGCCGAATNIITNFNFSPPTTPASVPTLSEWGMVILSALMALVTFVVMRRRRM